MGKIFDALEKSKKEKISSVATNRTPYKKDLIKKIVSIKKEQKDSVILHKALDNEKKVRQVKQVAPSYWTKAPYHPNNIDENLVALLEPQSFEAEQFKIIRTNLLFPVSGKPPRSIIVTSAVPGEGKSFTAANLAISIAQNIQDHVLLIDCDMRKPSIHSQFGISNVPGLSEYLSKGTALSSLLLKSAVNKLTILPAGKPPDNPSELLSSNRMSKLLEEVKDRYSDRYIIIDTPPPLLAPETSAISRQVDGIILVVKYGTTPRNMVSNLTEIVGKEKILGIVFNKFDMRFSGYSGYGKYGKYVR